MLVSIFYLTSFVIILSDWPVDSAQGLWHMNSMYLTTFSLSLIMGFILGVLFYGLSRLAYVFLLKDKCSKFPKHIFITTVLIVAFTIPSVQAVFWYKDYKQVKSVVIKFARLAEIPVNATEIKFGKAENILAASSYLMYKASSAEIDKFIEVSEGLHNTSPQVIDSKNRPNFEHTTPPGLMVWFNPDSIKKGRFYTDTTGKFTGSDVFIDDINNRVYVLVTSN